MVEVAHCPFDSRLARIEPDDRLVVLARTIEARAPEAETVLKESAINWTRFGTTCLGQALYRHSSVFQNTAETPAWSHLELGYFRDIVPAGDSPLDFQRFLGGGGRCARERRQVGAIDERTRRLWLPRGGTRTRNH